jgi:hypothetical protein
MRSRLLDAHDRSSWPASVKLIGVGNRIWRFGDRSGSEVGRYAWKVSVLPIVTVVWAVGFAWNRRQPRMRSDST